MSRNKVIQDKAMVRSKIMKKTLNKSKLKNLRRKLKTSQLRKKLPQKNKVE